ncbi:MAG: VOC family protein [Polyangiaceae bacterium]
MSLQTTTHLNFRGTAHRALTFYASVFGGEATLVPYSAFGMPKDAPGADHVVFGQVESPNGFRIMAYDVPGSPPNGATTNAGSTRRENGTTITDRTFFQSLSCDSLEEMKDYWNALAEGGTIVEPLAASPWSAGFGMLTDRFGVTWVFDVKAKT